VIHDGRDGDGGEKYAMEKSGAGVAGSLKRNSLPAAPGSLEGTTFERRKVKMAAAVKTMVALRDSAWCGEGVAMAML